MSDEQDTPQERARISVEQWRAAMLAKGIPRVQAGGKYTPTRRQRIGRTVRRWRRRLGEWVAGMSFDEW